MKQRQHYLQVAAFALSAACFCLSGPAWAGICIEDNSRTPGSCTYTAEQEGVHRFTITLPRSSQPTIAGHACGKPVQQPDQKFQAVCYAYLNSGAAYPVTAPGNAGVDVVPAEPAPGAVVFIP
jgi:hypothetical protein